MSSTTVVKDPVCGMDVETANAAGHDGETYYFCGSACKEKFDKNPSQYLDKQVGTAKSGHGCCG